MANVLNGVGGSFLHGRYKMQRGSLVSSTVEEKKVTDLTRLVTQSMENAFNCCERRLEKKKSKKLLTSRCTIFREAQRGKINHVFNSVIAQIICHSNFFLLSNLAKTWPYEWQIFHVWPQICTKHGAVFMVISLPIITR